MADLLLKTKLGTPSIRAKLVSRPDLAERLEGGLLAGHSLTLISAPAGFGKTTLVAGWLGSSGHVAAWLSLDEEDNDPIRFWCYVVAALRAVRASFGEAVLAALQAPRPPPLEPLLAALINDLAIDPVPLILVLDDYHLITEAAIHRSVGYLLDHLPPHVHIVIVTRADPPLSLPRRRARGGLTEIRTADLAFTREEAAAFLNVGARLGLSADDVATLAERTEGWVVGLQMAAIALQSRGTPSSGSPQASSERHAFVSAFGGDDRYIFDYLVEEVLARQDPHVQSFLLKTSILDRLCSSLCDAVTRRSDGGEILDYLERANLFMVPLDNRREWYRYHHLFRDLLRHRLRQSDGEESIAALHRRASRWYEENGLIAEAVSQVLSLPDLAHAAALIERHGLPLLYRGDVVPVQQWLHRLPEQWVRSRPYLCVLCAWAEFLASWSWYSFDVSKVVEPWLKNAERALADVPQDEAETVLDRRKLTESHIAALHALLAFYDADEPQRIVDLCLRALDRLPGDALGLRSNLLRNLGYIYQSLYGVEATERVWGEADAHWEAGGYAQAPFTAVHEHAWVAAWRGRLHKAEALCRQALQFITDPSPIAGVICNQWGEALVERGEWAEAEHVLLRGRELLKLAPWPERQAAGLAILARLRQAQGEWDATKDLLDQMERLSDKTASQAANLRVRLWLSRADHEPDLLARAVRWAGGCEIDLDDAGYYHLTPLTLIRVRIAQRQLTQDRPDLDAVFRFLDRYLAYAERWGAAGQAIEALNLRALALQAQGDVSQALVFVQRALALGEAEGYVYAFLQEGAPMARLLRKLDASHAPASYVARLVATFPATSEPDVPPASAAQGALIESLTPREMEVLQLIAAGASNPEIARALFIAVDTVKRHCTHIYRKLDVSNRTQAAMRAGELSLIE
jgi:LuxR family maltose regulon positive regulatory protein